MVNLPHTWFNRSKLHFVIKNLRNHAHWGLQPTNFSLKQRTQETINDKAVYINHGLGRGKVLGGRQIYLGTHIRTLDIGSQPFDILAVRPAPFYRWWMDPRQRENKHKIVAPPMLTPWLSFQFGAQPPAFLSTVPWAKPSKRMLTPHDFIWICGTDINLY